MSNFHCQAINPNTGNIESAIAYDTGEGFLIRFNDGRSYPSHTLKSNITEIADKDYPAINKETV